MHGFPETLTADDLTLRPMEAADLPEIAQHLNDMRIARWFAAIPHPFTAAAEEELLAFGRDPGEHLRVVERAGLTIGGLCLGSSLWYWLVPDGWGQGVMRRCVQLAVAARFRQQGPPVHATCHVENAASRSLLTKLGFSPSPAGRRMFFQSTTRSEPWWDYVLAPEQWFLLNPPTIVAGATVLRPALQKDAAVLAHMLPRDGCQVWPAAEALPRFIETHRFRGPARGLFVIVDGNRRSVGMALIQEQKHSLRFLTDHEDRRHRGDVEAALALERQTWGGS